MNSEDFAIRIWLAMIEQYPTRAVRILRNIRDGAAQLPDRLGAPMGRKLSWADCYDGHLLMEYLDNWAGCPKAADLARLKDDVADTEQVYTKKTLLAQLQKLLADECGTPSEAMELHRRMEMAEAIVQEQKPEVRYSTEMVAEHIWRALIILDWPRALRLMEIIYNGDAHFKAAHGAPAPILFSRFDVRDAAKLEYFLSGLTDPIYIDELTRRVPAGQAGDFHREFMTFAFKRCTAEQKEQFHEMFFGRSPSPEIEKEVVNSTPDHGELVEMIPTKISKTFEDFIDCGELLGIPATTLAILLPEEIRQKIRMEILEDMLSK